MDPDECLAELLKLAESIVNGYAATAEENELAHGIVALNEWILGGGFPPAQWDSIRIANGR